MTERRHILAVDDEDGILEIIQVVLEDEGYHVTLAQDGSEALDVLGSVKPDLILLDMRMPGMNGWEFAEAYRKRSGRLTPIVVMTAARDAAERAAEIEADGYIGKPFDIDRLIEVVEKHMRNGAS